MKTIKIIASLLLVIALMLSMGITATAATETGSITIENPVAKQSYYVYRIFDLEGYDKTNNAYSYVLNDAWDDFANQSSISGKFISLESAGDKTYVKWIEGADAVEFAALALQWANAHTNDVFITDGITPLTGEPIVFTNLPLGYYLIDSSVGALCALTTNDPNATVHEKNSMTTIKKLVKDNVTNDYVTENSAKIGDTVSFKSELTLGEGTENLVVHDLMTGFLSLKADSIKVYIEQSEVDSANYTVKDSKNGTVSIGDNCTFDIVFDNSFVKSQKKNTVLRIEYDALVYYDGKEWTSFRNDTWVTFGDQIKSTTSSTITTTCELDIVKTDDKGSVIGTAEFYLYDHKQNGNIIPLVALSEDDASGIYRYRVAKAGDDEYSGTGAAIKAGYAHIYGLGEGVYYLEEVRQPEGYNKLSERVEVDMTNGSIKLDTTDNFFSSTGSAIGSDATGKGGVQVINKTGTLLPSTGGIGTTIFYAGGGLLVLASGVLLITKKRMKKEDK